MKNIHKKSFLTKLLEYQFIIFQGFTYFSEAPILRISSELLLLKTASWFHHEKYQVLTAHSPAKSEQQTNKAKK